MFEYATATTCEAIETLGEPAEHDRRVVGGFDELVEQHDVEAREVGAEGLHEWLRQQCLLVVDDLSGELDAEVVGRGDEVVMPSTENQDRTRRAASARFVHLDELAEEQAEVGDEMIVIEPAPHAFPAPRCRSSPSPTCRPDRRRRDHRRDSGRSAHPCGERGIAAAASHRQGKE